MTTLQVPSIILPTIGVLGTEVETVNDLVEHTSIEFPVEYLQEKMVHIIATEVVVVPGVPGNLNCWIELSPLPSVNSLMWPAPLPVNPAAWAAIGGGGGALAPVAPVVEVGTGVNAVVHTILIPWEIHSAWARLVVQTPVSATPLTAYWILQAAFTAGSK
ncbi:MAG: hypothetical protein E3J81_07425 [Dehalococcoidia bacterium]|nr:MAG: hypothetical protein E3J81_07425 [Dehalococcoidia bacterium]